MARRDRRHEIMLAAERVFTNRRFHEVTLDMIAAEARVGKGTIYRYFGDKEDLFLQTATSGFDEVCDLLHARVPEDDGFRERLLSACRQINAYAERRRHLTHMMDVEEGQLMWERRGVRRRWIEKRARLVEALAAIIRQGIDEGQVRRDVSAPVLATYLLGMLRTRERDLCDAAPEERSLEAMLVLYCGGALRASATSSDGEADRS